MPCVGCNKVPHWRVCMVFCHLFHSQGGQASLSLNQHTAFSIATEFGPEEDNKPDMAHMLLKWERVHNKAAKEHVSASAEG